MTSARDRQPPRPAPATTPTAAVGDEAPPLLLAADSQAALLAALDHGVASRVATGTWRLAVLRPTPERLRKARTIVARGKASQGLQDIWFSPAGLLTSGGKLVFMYPGIDSLERPELADVTAHFRLPPVRTAADVGVHARGAEVFTHSQVYTKVLERLGIVPELICGHSLGEWSGMLAAGYSREVQIDDAATVLQTSLRPATDLVFVALGCGVATARALIEGLPDIEVSHDNCPHQSIVCGSEASADAVLARLRTKKVIGQKLDFRSGFHTSFFADYLAPIARLFARFTLTPPVTPLWSATICGPYPTAAEPARALAMRHLVEPVRFRELTEALYAHGARVFLQVGAGGLTGFVADTLRGRPHLAVAAATANRPGLEQLQRLSLALFVEGANGPLAWLGAARAQEPQAVATVTNFVPPRRSPTAADADLLAELEACFAAIQSATRAVTAALHTTLPFQTTVERTLSIADRPELLDHTFYKQKSGWQNLQDLFPVMPLTASIDLVMRVALEIFPERQVIAIESLAASRWLSVETTKKVALELSYDGKGRLQVSIVGHFVATLVLAAEYPPAPAPALAPLHNPRPQTIALERVYADGWLFHGPAYQGLSRLGELGDNGLVGSIRASTVPGALLDNVGQLAGLWIMQALPIDRYAMPIRIKRIEFFGPQPQSGHVDCHVRSARIRTRDIMFHMELRAGPADRVWARIEGWEKWRFESDAVHWQFLLTPGRSALSETKDGFTWFERPLLSDALCDDLARRYLREAEREVYQKLGRKRQSWLCGRIAAKDAIRAHLWRSGYTQPIFPAEIWIDNDDLGKPVVREAPGDTALHVSIAHKDGAAVASVSADGALGIDLEKIEARTSGFEALVLTEGERGLLPVHDRPEWVTRFWTAKEAVAKKSGRGLGGDPRQFIVEACHHELERLRIAQSWVRSTRIGAYIISQTEG